MLSSSREVLGFALKNAETSHVQVFRCSQWLNPGLVGTPACIVGRKKGPDQISFAVLDQKRPNKLYEFGILGSKNADKMPNRNAKCSRSPMQCSKRCGPPPTACTRPGKSWADSACKTCRLECKRGFFQEYPPGELHEALTTNLPAMAMARRTAQTESSFIGSFLWASCKSWTGIKHSSAPAWPLHASGACDPSGCEASAIN